MDTASDRQARDAAYYDELWRKRFRKSELLVPSDEELARQDLGRLLGVVWERLGNIDGARVLELGAGSGDYTVMLARRGGEITAVDVSEAAGEFTLARAEANGVGERICFVQMGVEQLAFADQSFDLVVGFGILHHVDVERAGPEIRRVLDAGGRAVFREPLGENPVLELARNRVPYRDKARSPNERPMTYDKITDIGVYFGQVDVREMYLLSMVTRGMGRGPSWDWLWRIDEWLLRRIPVLRRFCRYGVIEYRV